MLHSTIKELAASIIPLLVCKSGTGAYVEKFWVELMDGDGNVQVNHERTTSLQFRLVIKLKSSSGNKRMLQTVVDNLGGS